MNEPGSVLERPPGTSEGLWRICVHEAGHFLAALHLGLRIGDVTIHVLSGEPLELRNYVQVFWCPEERVHAALTAAAGIAAERLAGFHREHDLEDPDVAAFARAEVAPIESFGRYVSEVAAFLGRGDRPARLREVAVVFAESAGTTFGAESVFDRIEWMRELWAPRATKRGEGNA